MNKNNSGNNYLEAKSEADKVDLEIINALKDGVSFRVEAGAGSGKTYSLNKACLLYTSDAADDTSEV